ncbi:MULTISPECIES: Calx-beta domain-containing protein [unclassified Azospirillum]|uniref:Calx-beta domain-containing protein n=1 Tax=unclassified Azospirillum TaxID=2630922 RepID=UPI000B63EA05|nr:MULTISPECIES: Calx-beta domain-containing protein [unclassified Azospirillum]SNS23347.1 Calx-beta domain-containing protein [Azospirillum sp. RU38E]SNS41490.1 Calx-beta domain-containing protein [Azospirillum sp. RU37A]
MSQDQITLAAPTVGPQISVSGGSITEGNLVRLVYTVTLSAPAVDAVSVRYRLSDTGTVSDSDMNYPVWDNDNWGTLTIAAGQTQGTINISVAHDAVDEVDEFAVLELYNPTGGHFLDGYPVLRAEGVILDNDGLGSNLAMFVSDPVIVEGDAGSHEAVFTVRLSRAATQAFTASYETISGSAIAGSDFQASSGVVAFAVGQDTATVRVPVIGDGVVEATETFHLRVTPPAGLAIDTSGAFGTTTIMDDDAGTGPVLSVEPSRTTENYENRLGFTLTLSEAPLDAVTVQYRLVGGTANDTDIQGGYADSDYRGSVTFAPGQTSAALTFWTSGNDATDERDEHVILELYDPSGAALAGGGVVLRTPGVILDNDGSGSNLALFVADPVVVVEGDSGQREALFEVRLSRPATEALSFTYATKDGSALAGSDYQATSGNLFFVPGQDVAYVRVLVLGDTVLESSESFFLAVTPPAGLSIGLVGATGEARILEDDGGGRPVISVAAQTAVEDYSGAMRFHVSLSAAATDSVTVAYRIVPKTASDLDISSAFANRGGTITFAPGSTSTELSLPSIQLAGDALDEVDEAFTIELYNPAGGVLAGGGPVLRATGIILDDYPSVNSNLAVIVSDPVILESGATGAEAVFEVRLSRPSEQALSFSYATADGNAAAGLDYQATSGSLSFAPGQEVAYVRVPILGDTIAEASEYFSLVVTPPSTVAIAKAGAAGHALILDDDASTSQPVLTISQAEGVENYSGAMRFVVTLSQPALDAVTVQVRTSLGTALDDDLSRPASATQNNGTLTIPAGATSASFTVGLTGDVTDERDETILVTLSDPVGAVLAGGVDSLQAVGVILDDDGPGLNIALIAQDLTVKEMRAGEQPVEVLVSLSRPSETALTFDVGIGQGTAASSDYVLHDRQVTFAPGQTVAGVSLSVRGDLVVEGVETLVLTYTPVAGAAIAGTMPTSTITIQDFVPPSLSVVTNDVSQQEGRAGAVTAYSFTVTRSGNILEDSAVDWSVTGLGTNAADAADFVGGVLPSGRVSFAAGVRTATVTLNVAGDGVGEADEGFRLILSNPYSATITQATADAAILNDDTTYTIFSLEVYRALNPDVVAVFGNNDAAIIRHYIDYGRGENRVSSGFDLDAYAALNPDLFNAFGVDSSALSNHYLRFGRTEQRATFGFDAEAYAALNPDLFNAFGLDQGALIRHYINNGQAEGRVTLGFDAEAYAALNPDLFNAYGLNHAALISHYINHGRAEGRQVMGFDVDAYAALNPDLLDIFGYDPTALINHYQYAGRAEGRPAFTSSTPSAALAENSLSLLGLVDEVG